MDERLEGSKMLIYYVPHPRKQAVGCMMLLKALGPSPVLGLGNCREPTTRLKQSQKKNQQ
jgi:hypothetical protein